MNLAVLRSNNCFSFSISHCAFVLANQRSYGIHYSAFTLTQHLHCIFPPLTVEFFFSCIVWALKTFKEAVFDDPDHVLSNWNPLVTDPCDWDGVSCNGSRDHVIKL